MGRTLIAIIGWLQFVFIKNTNDLKFFGPFAVEYLVHLLPSKSGC